MKPEERALAAMTVTQPVVAAGEGILTTTTFEFLVPQVAQAIRDGEREERDRWHKPLAAIFTGLPDDPERAAEMIGARVIAAHGVKEGLALALEKAERDRDAAMDEARIMGERARKAEGVPKELVNGIMIVPCIDCGLYLNVKTEARGALSARHFCVSGKEAAPP